MHVLLFVKHVEGDLKRTLFGIGQTFNTLEL